jgi:hypothetical protein
VSVITLARAICVDGSASGTHGFESGGFAVPALRVKFAKRKAVLSASGGRAKPLKKIKATAGQSHICIIFFA